MSNKLIHRYKFKFFSYNPEYITCSMNNLNTKYNLNYDINYNFAMGLTAIKNKGIYDTKNSMELFNIINIEQQYVKFKNINNNKFNNINNIIIKYYNENIINNNIKIADCLRKTADYTLSTDLWNFGSDEALFNYLIYKNIKISDITVYSTTMHVFHDYSVEIQAELISKRKELELEIKDIKSFFPKNEYITKKDKIIFNYLFDKEIALENQYESRDMFKTDDEYYNQYYNEYYNYDKKDFLSRDKFISDNEYFKQFSDNKYQVFKYEILVFNNDVLN